MRLNRALALGAAMLVLLSACSSGGSKPTIKIGSDGFYEAKLMAEIYGQALEANGYSVDRTGIGLGARKVTAPALESGQFDLKPEYIGSGLSYYEAGKQTGDPTANATELQNVLNGKGGGITVLSFTPAQDQNAFVVRKDTADQLHLTKMSDVAAVQSQLKLGLATDCPTNPVCGQALKDAYGLDTTKATLLAAAVTRRWPTPSRPRPSTSASCARRSPTSWSTGSSCSRTTSRLSPRTTSLRWSGTTSWPKVDKTAFEKILNDVVGQDGYGDPGRSRQADRGRQEGRRGRREELGSRRTAS